MLTLFRDFFSPPRHIILLVIAAWIGLYLAEKRSERFSIKKDVLNNIVFYGILAFIIGGRISYALQHISIFFKSPLGVISINPNLFDLFGAVATAFFITIIYSQKSKLPFWNLLDALTPFFAILSIGLGLSHLAAGSAFGKETDLIWGINLWNAVRHPTQIYEMLASFLIFSLLWLKKHDPRPGMFFLIFAALTAGSQLFIQAFRGDSILIFNSIHQDQALAWVVLAICFGLIEMRIKHHEKTRANKKLV